MKWHKIQLDKFINKALGIVEAGITIEEIREAEGKVKGKRSKDDLPYYMKYPWRSQEEVDKFREYLKKEIAKASPEMTENKIETEADWLEALISLSEINIIKEKSKVINDPLKEEKV